MAMTQSEVKTSRMILYIEAIVSLVYGLVFLLIPGWMFALSQDQEFLTLLAGCGGAVACLLV